MKILLVNFLECPENAHFERALDRVCARRKIALDIIHDNRFDYGFIGKFKSGGKKVAYESLSGFRAELGKKRDLVIILDFAGRERCVPAFLRAFKAETPKLFVLNHLIYLRGQKLSADLARKHRIFSMADYLCMLDSDDRLGWQEFGIPRRGVLKRGYCVDTVYYEYAGHGGDFVFSAGSAGRNYAVLGKACRSLGFKLKIFSDLFKKTDIGNGGEKRIFSGNLAGIKGEIGNSSLVVLPLKDSYANESAGNSIIFMAMSMGKIVLTRKTAYMEKYISEGENGFFYGSLSRKLLEKRIAGISAIPGEKKEKISKAARETMLKKASLDGFVESLVGRI